VINQSFKWRRVELLARASFTLLLSLIDDASKALTKTIADIITHAFDSIEQHLFENPNVDAKRLLEVTRTRIRHRRGGREHMRRKKPTYCF
jgi:hypothetical protein